MVSKLNNDSITRKVFANAASVPQQETENQVAQDQATDTIGESRTSLAGATSVAVYARGILDMEADLRRCTVERDLDQPNMASAKAYEKQTDEDIASAKTFQSQSDQDIVSAVVGKRTEKMDPE